MNNIKLISVLFVSLVINIGCQATAPVINADTVKNEGLLVGHMGTRRGYHHGHVRINGQEYQKVINDNYLRVPLKPGKYQFEEIVEVTTTYNQTRTSTLPVKFEFEIRSGEVTNVGEMVFYFPDKKSSKFTIMYIDDAKQAARALRDKHPDAYAALRSKKFIKAKVKYLSAENIKSVRAAMLNSPSMESKYFVAGNVGAFARVNRNRNGNVTGFKMIETGSYSTLGPCGQNGVRTACVVPGTSAGTQILVTNGAKHKIHNFSVNDDISIVELPGKKEIILVSNKMKVFTSLNEGASWSVHDKSVVTESLTGAYGPKISWGKKGYYIYSGSDDATLLYRKYNSPAKYDVIEPPAKGNKIGNIIETLHGVYAGPEFSFSDDGIIYFKSNGMNQWIKRTVPQSSCSLIKIADERKGSIAVYCNSQFYITENQGQSWREARINEVKTTN